VSGDHNEADLGEGLLGEGAGVAAGLGAQFGAVDAVEAEALRARLEAEAEIDDGDEGVAVDDALGPGNVGVPAGAGAAYAAGVPAGIAGDGDCLAGAQPLETDESGGAGQAKAQVEVRLDVEGIGTDLRKRRISPRVE